MKNLHVNLAIFFIFQFSLPIKLNSKIIEHNNLQVLVCHIMLLIMFFLKFEYHLHKNLL